MAFLIFLFFIRSSASVAESQCPHSEKTGREILERVYAAETYRHLVLGEKYNDNVEALGFNRDGLEPRCDIQNWSISIHLNGTTKYVATAKSKITGKTLSVNEIKEWSSK